MPTTLRIAWHGRSQAREGRAARPRSGEEGEEEEEEGGDARGEVVRRRSGKASKEIAVYKERISKELLRTLVFEMQMSSCLVSPECTLWEGFFWRMPKQGMKQCKPPPLRNRAGTGHESCNGLNKKPI